MRAILSVGVVLTLGLAGCGPMTAEDAIMVKRGAERHRINIGAPPPAPASAPKACDESTAERADTGAEGCP